MAGSYRNSSSATDHLKIEPFSILMPCYNEEKNIEKKIESLQNQIPTDVPVEWIILSDGSDDNTNEILKKYEHFQNFRICYQQERRGKPTALNRMVAMAQYSLILFADARQELEKDCIKQLLAAMSDAHIGAAGCMLVHRHKHSFFRHWINKVKIWESRAGSTLGTYGCLYFIRRDLYVPLPGNLILDDLYTPLQILRQGKKVIINEKAIVYDLPFSDMYKSHRLDRINAGLIQMIKEYRPLLLSLPGRYKAALFFQKYAKFFVPPLLIVQFLILLAGYDRPIVKYVLYAQTAIVLLGWLLSRLLDIAAVQELYRIFFRYLKTAPALFSRHQDVKWVK